MNIKSMIHDICSDDAMTFEDAYHQILPHVDRLKFDLLTAMKQQKDAKKRARFIELLGYSKDESLIEVFKQELESEEFEVVSWSLFALENSPSKEGTIIAGQFKKANPKYSE